MTPRKRAIVGGIFAIGLSPFAFAAPTAPVGIAGGPPGIIEPAPPPPPGVAPAVNAQPPPRQCGSDLFTGAPIYC